MANALDKQAQSETYLRQISTAEEANMLFKRDLAGTEIPKYVYHNSRSASS